MTLIDCHSCRHASNMGAMVGCNKKRTMVINPHIECELYEPVNVDEFMKFFVETIRGMKNARD